MIVTGVSLDTVRDVVEKVSAVSYRDNIALDGNETALSGTRSRVRLRALNSRDAGARRSWQGRHMPVACWHAYRDVISAVFDVNPKARVYTGMARYIGREGFEREYPATGNHNIGSMMQPAYMPDLCDCES